jgi:hypothetical protein
MNWFLDAGIFERFRGILHEGEIDKRVQFMIEGLFNLQDPVPGRFHCCPKVSLQSDESLPTSL